MRDQSRTTSNMYSTPFITNLMTKVKSPAAKSPTTERECSPLSNYFEVRVNVYRFLREDNEVRGLSQQLSGFDF